MLSAKDLLKLDWDELCKQDDFRIAVLEGIGPKGPWEHDPTGFSCCRCGTTTVECTAPCPVPPPITLEPEVVAERLKKIVVSAEKRDEDVRQGSLYHAARTAMEVADDVASFFVWRWLYLATSVEQVVACLLALNLIGK